MATTTRTTARAPKKPVSKLARKKAIIQADRAAKKALTGLIKNIVTDLSLDEDRMAKRVDSAIKSEYGAINGLVNLVAAISNWPVENGDGSLVSTNRMILEDKFNLDLVMLDDIRRFRGFHSFVTDDIEIIAGTEPDYENYTDYCQIFLEELGVKSNRPTINPDAWARAEAKATIKATADQAQMERELAVHKAYMDELEGEGQ